ncbi:sodium:solute symporter [Phycisphaera mikurensis]|nr:sodium:solute symporter [Phycisphaera mikurensis]MBB6443410.1 SSS family transporter [Phycisphaera mikurensis]
MPIASSLLRGASAAALLLVSASLGPTANAGGALREAPTGVPVPSAGPGAAAGAVDDAAVVLGKAGAWMLPEGAEAWETVALDAAAFAAVAADAASGTLYLAGGIAGGRPHAAVRAVTRAGDAVRERRLADLPRARAMAGAAVVRGALYVLGGLDAVGEDGTSTLFRLDLADAAAGWETLAPLPGPPLILPSVSGLYDQLNVFGGLQRDGDGGWAPVAAAWCFRRVPLDGTVRTGWLPMTDLPESRAAAGVWATGQAHALLLGGLTGPVTLADLLAGEASLPRSRDTRLFHAITETWLPGEPLSAPSALATALPRAGRTLLLPGLGGAGAGTAATLSALSLDVTTRRMGGLDYAVILGYFLLMAGIGVWFARRQTSSEEFALGGRNVRWWAAGISMFATGASSISFMAIPAQTFRTNLVWFAPLVVFIVPMYLLQAYVIYPLLRRLRLTSTYEFLERRYNPPLRVLASLQSISFQLLGRMSVVMLLPALAISAVTGLDVMLSVALMGLLTTVYTAIGGFEAVIWTDVTQGLLMMFGCALMAILAIASLPGGVGEFVSTSVAFQRFDFAIWRMDLTLPVLWIAVLSMLMANLGFAADQPTVQRVYATPLRDMRKLAMTYAVCSLVIAGLVNFLGVAMFSWFHAFPERLDPTMSNDQVVPLFVVERLPAGVAGLIVAALFAASMSTLSSSMNSVATLVSEDFYRRFVPGSTDAGRLRLMRWASLLAGAFGTGVALYMARMDITSMFQAWSEITALLGGGFVGIYILGMFTTRTGSAGAIAGALASVAAAIYVKQYTPLHWLYYGPAAIIACVAVGYLVSLVLPRRPRDLTGLTIFTPAREISDADLPDAAPAAAGRGR